MPQIVVSADAFRDLDRLGGFLRRKDQRAASRAIAKMLSAIKILSLHPYTGKEIQGYEDRELVIEFGESGYIARYRIRDTVIIVVSFRHQKEFEG